MRSDLCETAIHATAVVIDGRALVILGASRSGKSRLAVALMRLSTPDRAILLIGDDRILLTRRGSLTVARPHPRIAGFIERRGLGLCAEPFCAQAPVAALVHLDDARPAQDYLANFPAFIVVEEMNRPDVSRDLPLRVLTWFRERAGAACETQVGAKAGDGASSRAKD